MFEKLASEMAVGSSAVITSLGLLRGAIIRRTKEDLWEQMSGDFRTRTGVHYRWHRRSLPKFIVRVWTGRGSQMNGTGNAVPLRGEAIGERPLDAPIRLSDWRASSRRSFTTS
jgi:hypothetical protein